MKINSSLDVSGSCSCESVLSDTTVSGQIIGADTQIYISGIAVGDRLGSFAGSGGGVTDHGDLTGLTDDDHQQYLLTDASRSVAGDFVADFSQFRNLGTPSVNWAGFFVTSGILDSGIFPLFSNNGKLGNEDRIWESCHFLSGVAVEGFFPLFSTNGYLGNETRSWKEVHAESGFFSKEFFFKGFSAHMANVYCGHNSSTTLTINNTQQVVPINTDVVIDFNYTRSSDTVTIATDGLYKMTAECSVEIINTGGGPRGKIRLTLQLDGTDIIGAESLEWLEETGSNGACNLKISWIDGFVANSQIRMTIQDLVATEPNEQVAANTARLIIERIR